MATDGRRAIVGATGEAECGPNAGAAYVFERDERGHFQPATRLAPAECEPGGFFGRAVAIDGDIALVAAGGEVVDPHRPNRVYVFERDSTGTWLQAAILAPEPGRTEGAFATTVSLSGARALVTTSGDPAQRRYGGAAYIFERDDAGRWGQTARLTGSGGLRAGLFGSHGSLDGDRAAVTASPYGARGTGTVYVFEQDDAGRWHEAARIGGAEGYLIRADLDGDRLLVGHPRAGPGRAGAAVLYGRTSEGRWRPLATLRPSVPYRDGAFGSAVSLDGPRALVTGYTEQIGLRFNIDRVVYVFDYEGERGWTQRQVLDVGAWAFGAAIDHAGDVALIGRASDAEAGAVYVVELLGSGNRSGVSW